jgi:hypothetical protein
MRAQNFGSSIDTSTVLLMLLNWEAVSALFPASLLESSALIEG